MKNNCRWARETVALLVILAIFTTSCLQFKTNTDIKMEPYKDAVTIYKKNASASDGYAAEQIELTRYKVAKVQNTVLDVGQTILNTLEMIGSISLSVAMLMMLKTAQTLGRMY